MQKVLFIQRNINEKLKKALKRSPVVLLTGARQTGKTTLMKQLCKDQDYSYVTFDDLRYLSAAKSDPIGFISNLKKPVVLDEIQRVPELFLVIKTVVDENRKPGMFVLTGSANPLLIPRLGDSLVGRMEILELFPLSQGELHGVKETFIDGLFSDDSYGLKLKTSSKEDFCRKLITGGYPLVQNLDSEGMYAWFNSYLTTILQRDVKDLARIEGITQLPNLLNLIATRVGGLLNVSELSRSSGISSSTLHRYLTLLETLFMIAFLQPWSVNLGKRLVKSPKVYLIDSGILLHLLRVDKTKLFSDTNIFGKALENFVIMELLKQATWSKLDVKIFNYRTQTGIEVDAILEDSSGRVVGIEIKGSETVSSNDFKGLQQLQKIIGKAFVKGIVLYNGNERVPFGNNLWAIPINSLWA